MSSILQAAHSSSRRREALQDTSRPYRQRMAATPVNNPAFYSAVNPQRECLVTPPWKRLAPAPTWVLDPSLVISVDTSNSHHGRHVQEDSLLEVFRPMGAGYDPPGPYTADPMPNEVLHSTDTESATAIYLRTLRKLLKARVLLLNKKFPVDMARNDRFRHFAVPGKFQKMRTRLLMVAHPSPDRPSHLRNKCVATYHNSVHKTQFDVSGPKNWAEILTFRPSVPRWNPHNPILKHTTSYEDVDIGTLGPNNSPWPKFQRAHTIRSMLFQDYAMPYNKSLRFKERFIPELTKALALDPPSHPHFLRFGFGNFLENAEETMFAKVLLALSVHDELDLRVTREEVDTLIKFIAQRRITCLTRYPFLTSVYTSMTLGKTREMRSMCTCDPCRQGGQETPFIHLPHFIRGMQHEDPPLTKWAKHKCEEIAYPVGKRPSSSDLQYAKHKMRLLAP